LYFRSAVVFRVSYAVGKFAGGHQRSSFRQCALMVRS
jgi:hypothetical protein